MEFEFGESEKGCGMFESLLVNYPKRLDIWNVYADVLVKHHDIKRARYNIVIFQYFELILFYLIIFYFYFI